MYRGTCKRYSKVTVIILIERYEIKSGSTRLDLQKIPRTQFLLLNSKKKHYIATHKASSFQ